MSARARTNNASSARSSTYSSTKETPVPRKASDQNQVVPFRLDDGEDDNEEIRRRRYSSCSSSSSNEDAPNKRSHASYKDSKKSSHSFRERENEWEKASSHGASSSSGEEEDLDDDDDDEESASPYKTSSNEEEEPESPRKNRHRTQQSDEESDDEYDGPKKPTAAAAVPTASRARAKTTPVPPSQPQELPVDLSRISKLAVFPGSETQLLQGHIVRVKTLLHPQYHFFIKNQLILMAEKQLKNRTSNYHMFDMTRSTALTAKLTKKSGNYLGKLRSNFSKKKNVLVGNLSKKTELGAILFDNSTVSSEPRRLNVILPALSAKRQEIEGLAVGDSITSFSLLIDMFKKSASSESGTTAARGASSSSPPAGLQVFENKEPVFENGFYRLNFNGRVSVPSVKNFQLVRAQADPSSTTKAEDNQDVLLQFGKVDDKKFHLDFRAPVTPIQAFAIAIAQFNL